jgi:hypothetical protein
MIVALRIVLLIGFAIDAYVGLLSLFAPMLIPPLLDIPLHDPQIVRLAGGEYIVAALVYALALRAPLASRPLLWLCALDQAFAVVMPTLGIVSGTLPNSWKIIAPIPLQAVFVVFFIYAAARKPKSA